MLASPSFLDFLEPEARELIERQTSEIVVEAGTDLFHEGERGDAVYFVRSGSLGAYVEQDVGPPRLVGLIGP
ncbi:MAG: cyclic nucleotide-binding domain-containing protein, partial [Methyloligellaceae bacterium]